MPFVHLLRREILWATLLFVVGILVGVSVFALAPWYAAPALSDAQQFIDTFAGLSPVALLFLILINNLLKIFLFMLAGLAFGIAPAFFLFMNGFVIGVVGSAGAAEHGAPALLAALIPHGVFEIPAALLGAAAGIHLGKLALRRLAGHGAPLREGIGRSLALFGRVVAPLLILAALVEVFITPAILAAVLVITS
jgi:stage II sporulation protein M